MTVHKIFITISALIVSCIWWCCSAELLIEVRLALTHLSIFSYVAVCVPRAKL